eukprot:m.149245 g.149245  ORF g.149245 m.149245 type:complete len:76 (+) comp17808_c0_seq2:1759-1986(+)
MWACTPIGGTTRTQSRARRDDRNYFSSHLVDVSCTARVFFVYVKATVTDHLPPRSTTGIYFDFPQQPGIHSIVFH